MCFPLMSIHQAELLVLQCFSYRMSAPRKVPLLYRTECACACARSDLGLRLTSAPELRRTRGVEQRQHPALSRVACQLACAVVARRAAPQQRPRRPEVPATHLGFGLGLRLGLGLGLGLG